MHAKLRLTPRSLLAMLLLPALPAAGFAAGPPRAVVEKIEPRLLAAAREGRRVPALLVLREQADLSAAQLLRSRTARTDFVHRAVRATAARSQAPLRAALDALGVRYRGYAIVNAIAVEDLSAAQLARLAARDDVAEIESDLPVRLDEPRPGPVPAADVPLAIGGVEWNVVRVGAPDVWALGFKGAGIVIASADTGVQWNHPALKTRYRGWRAASGKVRHKYNWWDAIHGDVSGNGTNPCGFSSRVPCDDWGHGTHTAGTAVGDDGAGNQIGVAPRAKWIGCRNMEEGFGRRSRYIECFDFFLAPWDLNGLNPDPAKAPHVINNSWSCIASEGCTSKSLRKAVRAARAAGIVVVASAGNSGPGCSTVATPPALYDASTTVGATDAGDVLALSSSRGPVTADGSSRTKPDLSAPGVSVRSSVPPSSYATYSGTSMAAPHVAGAVALLWSAHPALRGDVAATEQLLSATASPAVSASGTCGGTTSADIPNNLFGHGRVDVLAAFNATP